MVKQFLGVQMVKCANDLAIGTHFVSLIIIIIYCLLMFIVI